jgi:hypothetical protein
MIKQNGLSDQLPNEIQAAFDELQILQYLRKVGFKKKFGFTCSYLFQKDEDEKDLCFTNMRKNDLDRLRMFVLRQLKMPTVGRRINLRLQDGRTLKGPDLG